MKFHPHLSFFRKISLISRPSETCNVYHIYHIFWVQQELESVIKSGTSTPWSPILIITGQLYSTGVDVRCAPPVSCLPLRQTLHINCTEGHKATTNKQKDYHTFPGLEFTAYMPSSPLGPLGVNNPQSFQ